MEGLVGAIESFYKGRRVLITGHTGFKGAWLSMFLDKLGALVYGYALKPPTNPSLFVEARVNELVCSHIGDIRDYNKLYQVMNEVMPEIVIHLAAQPLVRESYAKPLETYEVNIMGTANLLEACRHIPSVKAVVNVTSDKCYDNQEWLWGYRESDRLGGFDPYSSSKGCSELITSAYRNSFFPAIHYQQHGVALASARAGNVIGGGDWAEDRLIPDFIRSLSDAKIVEIRSPKAVRPWQYVLEPLMGYLLLASKLYSDGIEYSGAWNFGPEDRDARNVEWVIERLCSLWGRNAGYKVKSNSTLHEALFLKLDCSKAKNRLQWRPVWSPETAILRIVEWFRAREDGQDMRLISQKQIALYCADYEGSTKE